MADIVCTVVDELLRYKQSRIADTEDFRNMRHNAYLCPAVEGQLNSILDCFIKYHSIAYDIQGINDQGTDVLLRVFEDDEAEEARRWFISFQIKSFDDLKSQDYLRDLRAQCNQAQSHLGDGLLRHFILLCTPFRLHQNKIRQIKGAFGPLDFVTVIDPVYVLTFLRLTPFRINAVVDSILRVGDIVHIRANQQLSEFSPTECALVLAIVSQTLMDPAASIHIETVRDLGFVQDVYANVPDYPRDHFFIRHDLEDIGKQEDDNGQPQVDDSPENLARPFHERFAEDINSLSAHEDTITSPDASGLIELVEIDGAEFHPVRGVMLDAMVRYEYHGDELLRYIFSIIGTGRLLGLDLE